MKILFLYDFYTMYNMRTFEDIEIKNKKRS